MGARARCAFPLLPAQLSAQGIIDGVGVEIATPPQVRNPAGLEQQSSIAAVDILLDVEVDSLSLWRRRRRYPGGTGNRGALRLGDGSLRRGSQDGTANTFCVERHFGGMGEWEVWVMLLMGKEVGEGVEAGLSR